jgi:alanine dehydrogenase
VAGAAAADPELALGLSTLRGHLANEPVAQAHDLPFRPPAELLTEV